MTCTGMIYWKQVIHESSLTNKSYQSALRKQKAKAAKILEMAATHRRNETKEYTKANRHIELSYTSESNATTTAEMQGISSVSWKITRITVKT